MKVSLLNATTDGLELLLFTKQTRLAMEPGLMEQIKAWPIERKMQELDYMLGTIQSSWEFVDYTFLIDGVTRAFTHQLVRTREGSYAQQSQRTVDMQMFPFVTPTALQEGSEGEVVYVNTMEQIDDGYRKMRELGVNPQDARGVLPTNVCTNIVAKFNLRTLHNMAKTRLCTRTQGEYQDVFREMRRLVIEAHPWTEPFLRVACAATGVCQFPNYKECPVKPSIFNPDSGKRWDEKEERPSTREEIQQIWEGCRFEAVPQQAKPTGEK